MFDKLDFITEKYDDLSRKVSDPDVIANQPVWQKYIKEMGEMEPIVKKYTEYKKAKEDLAEAKEMLEDGDEEMRELAKMEISDLVKSKEDLLENWNKTAGYIDYAYDPINGLASFRRMKAREKDVWSEAKNGQILISSGIPYTLGRETKPIYQKSNDLKTADLVNQLSEPIKKAMEVSAIDKINISGTITSTKIEYDINRMSQLIMNPKKD